MRIEKAGKPIRSVADWFRLAPPAKGEKHWVDGRSAKEVAKAWFPVPGDPQTPTELATLLASSPTLGTVTLEAGEPEALVYFDDLRGRPRHCDLLLTGACGLGPITVSVEAKADEPFGKLVREELEDSQQGRRRDRSHVPERVNRLAGALFGATRELVAGCRYQLLFGVGAAYSAARERGGVAAFVVHEFVGKATDDGKVRENQADLDRFVALLSGGAVKAVEPGRLYGPWTVPGNAHIPGTVPLLVGKAIRQL